ncbi:hypothetical protein L3049_16535 [Labilibaculum sp. DW002]|uniref:DUF4231 domain-containing protein n=1 Tax=Paralabilibaculum antarcticum TaxID=2912572 RepID=A0ABT5VW21_9BACT|nr:hypothetical protein [Labilibaculum sp. DW002]MDE5419600.1 hypothetical protein [Labilibaculum sp. DW002]
MNQELKKYLESETSDKLFYYFKFEGLLDFNKKIVAGTVLHERNYDTKILISEKSKLQESLKRQIAEFEDRSVFEYKIRKEQKKSLIHSLIFTVTIVSFYIYWYFELPDNRMTPTYLLIACNITFSLLMIYKLMSFKKSINYEIKRAEQDCKLQKQKLEIIDQEWKFE